MALVNGTNYDHIDLQAAAGGDVTRHPLQDTEGRAMIAPTEASATASAAHAKGSYFVLGGVLYQTTADIASGGTITPGTNCQGVPNGISGELASLAGGFDATLTPVDFQPSIAANSYIASASGAVASSPSGKYARTGLWKGTGYLTAIILANPAYECAVFYYDESGNISTGAGYLGNSGYRTGIQYVPYKAVKFGLSFRRADQAAMDSSDITAILAALSAYAATDTELSNRGMAADAKATGALKNAFDSDLVATSFLSSAIGFVLNYYYPYDTGVKTSTTNKYACTFSSAWQGKGTRKAVVLNDDSYKYYLSFYNASNVYLGHSDFSKGMQYIPNEAVYFAMTVMRSDEASMSSSDLTAIFNALSTYASTDRTLTTQGVAADAKAVGDKFASVAIDCPLEFGGISRVNGADGNSYSGYHSQLKTQLIKATGEIKLTVDETSIPGISYFRLFEYVDGNDGITYVSGSGDTQNTFTNGVCELTVSGDYIRIAIVVSPAITVYRPRTIKIEAVGAKLLKNPNIVNTEINGVLTFAYDVTPEIFTTAQLVLPPNYSITGTSVPLLVFLHSTQAYNKWDEKIGVMGNSDHFADIQYLANEGFAIFDCYLYTSKYYKTTDQIAPAPLPIFINAIISGIKYTCKYYNVDINRVCMYAYSLGGALAHWFMQDSNFTPRAIAMLAGSTGFASLVFQNFFLNESGRQIVADVLKLTDEPGCDDFITVSKGLNNNTVKAFVRNHLDSFAGLNPAAINTHGSTFAEQYDWMVTGTTVMPQWMIDENLPEFPSAYTTSPALGVPTVVQHPELTKYTNVPVKFWQAFDDENVSGHTNYTIFKWMQNAGANVKWRTMPNDTGKHYSVIGSANALKTSGTTSLGIAYTDVPVAYVEMAEFFRSIIDG